MITIREWCQTCGDPIWQDGKGWWRDAQTNQVECWGVYGETTSTPRSHAPKDQAPSSSAS